MRLNSVHFTLIRWILPFWSLLIAPAAAAPAAKPVADSAQPQISATTFGDWALRCQNLPGQSKDRMCEAAVTIQQKDSAGPVAKFALGRPAPNLPLRAIILLPTNISLPGTVKFFTDDKDSWGLDFIWRRCVPGGCFAEVTPSDDDLAKWRKAGGSAKIIFKDAEGRDIAIGIPFNGFSQALDALLK